MQRKQDQGRGRQLLQLDLTAVPTGPRVVINERAGSIVISGDVEIAPVAIAHRNIVVETGTMAGTGPFVAVDPAEKLTGWATIAV